MSTGQDEWHTNRAGNKGPIPNLETAEQGSKEHDGFDERENWERQRLNWADEHEAEERKAEEQERNKRRAEEVRGEWVSEIGEVRAVNQEEEEELEEDWGGAGNWEDHWARDDVTCDELDVEKVKEGRQEEARHMEGLGMFEEATQEEARRRSSGEPITTKRVDHKKMVDGREVGRCRVVARDFKKPGD